MINNIPESQRNVGQEACLLTFAEPLKDSAIRWLKQQSE